jgi:hypothetical protein
MKSSAHIFFAIIFDDSLQKSRSPSDQITKAEANLINLLISSSFND